MKTVNFSGSHRLGYTLMELLIALVLISALMSTVWGIMSMYNSLLSAGKNEVTEQQLVRSLFQLISEDLSTALSPLEDRKVIEVALSDVESEFADLAGLSEDEDLPERSVFEKSSKAANPAAPIFLGTSSAIRITTHRVVQQNRDPEQTREALLNEIGGGSVESNAVMGENQAPAVSEFQTVVYQFQLSGQDESAESLPSGLYRIQVDSLDLISLLNDRTVLQESRSSDDVQIDRLTLESLLFPQQDRREEIVDSQMKTEAIIPHYDLIPEVVGCRFEYFDGKSWSPNWPVGDNSEVSHPAAIRIRLEVINAEELDQLTELKSPVQGTQELEQELDDSFHVESDATEKHPGSSEAESDQMTASPLAGIKPRSYWRIILLENPELQLGSLGSLEGFQP